MDASPAARRVAFAIVVCAFAALGAYTLGPLAHRGGTPHRRAPVVGAGRTQATAQAGRPAGSPASIYQWLPFTQAGLTAAAETVVRFGDAYGSYSYSEDGAAYVAPMRSVASPQLVGQIQAAFDAPGVAAARQGEEQVSVGATTIGSIRAFGPGSLTFVVQVAQELTTTAGRSQEMTEYAVTVAGAGSTWQVSDVELASAGNT